MTLKVAGPVWLTYYIGAIGIWVFCVGIANAMEALGSRRWPVARAEVTHSKLSLEAGEVANHRRNFDLRYRFEVGGKFYTGHRLRYTAVWNTTSQARMERLQKRYRVGTQIEVYYHPQNHGKSVAEPGGGVGLLILPAIGLLFVAGAAANAGWLR